MKIIGNTKKYPEKILRLDLGETERIFMQPPFLFNSEWPIKLDNLDFHISCYYEEKDYTNPNGDSLYPHSGVDIQVERGTSIFAPENCEVITCGNVNHGRIGNLGEIILRNKESKIIYGLTHIDLDSVPKNIRDIQWFDGLEIPKGEFIGKVGKWPGELKEDVEIPQDVFEIFGRKYDHLHIGTLESGQMRDYTDYSVKGIRSCGYLFDPLFILKPLDIN